MTQFVKAIDKDGECYRYIGEKFPQISDSKLEAGVFDGLQIRKLMKNSDFINHMTDTENRHGYVLRM